MLIETKANLKPHQEEFLEFVIGDNFPWFYVNSGVGGTVFSHCVMDRSNNEFVEGTINSKYWDIVRDIFISFCEQNKIKVDMIYRAAFNLSLANSGLMSDIHVDHDFPHTNFLLYINDSSGNTILFNENEVMREVVPEKHKVFVFPGNPHAAKFCGVDERRIVLVITFKGNQYD